MTKTRKNGLPMKVILRWLKMYSAKKTLSQMSERTGLSKDKIRLILYYRSLTYKKTYRTRHQDPLSLPIEAPTYKEPKLLQPHYDGFFNVDALALWGGI